MSDEDTFADAPQGGISDAAKKAKFDRRYKKSSFTKRHGTFLKAVEGGKVHGNRFDEKYEFMVKAYEALEKSHKDYGDLVGEAIIDAENDYLGESYQLYSDAQITYDEILEERERAAVEEGNAKVQRGFEAAKSKVIAGMEAFEKSCAVLTKLGSNKSISFADMRAELVKIEAQYEKLSAERAEVESKFPSADVTELATKFSELVGEGFSKCKEIGLTYLQTDVVADGTTSRSRAVASTTKKETVMLPKFSGDEKTAYLKYPIWRKQWISHIDDYY